MGCHGVVRLVGFGLSRRCPLGPLGRFWAITVLSAWSAWAVLGCHGVVRVVGFGLSRCCPLGRFWAVVVLSAWALLLGLMLLQALCGDLFHDFFCCNVALVVCMRVSFQTRQADIPANVSPGNGHTCAQTNPQRGQMLRANKQNHQQRFVLPKASALTRKVTADKADSSCPQFAIARPKFRAAERGDFLWWRCCRGSEHCGDFDGDFAGIFVKTTNAFKKNPLKIRGKIRWHLQPPETHSPSEPH